MASQSTDPAKERLQQSLQMLDLGTQRRDFISTDDVRSKYSRITIDQINAERASNKIGSEVQRLAEKNKDQLNSWANAWKTLGDVNSEDLDPLMDGQSHRARLADQVKAYGGQSYAEEETKKPVTRSSSRGVRGGGRGGGVAGTRGRASFPASSRPIEQEHQNRAPNAKTSNHNVLPENQPRRQLDPALDPQPNSHGSRSRSKRVRSGHSQVENRNKSANKRDSGQRKLETSRRPITAGGPSFEHLLAPASDFLAAIPMISGNSSVVPPAAPTVAPPYNENSTFFSQGSDKLANLKKVGEPSNKSENKATPKNGGASKKNVTPKKDIAPKKGPASMVTPKKSISKQTQPVPTAPKANSNKKAPISDGLKVETMPKTAPASRPPPAEKKPKKATLPIAGPTQKASADIEPSQYAELSANQAPASCILGIEAPESPKAVSGAGESYADGSFASSLPQPSEDVASDGDGVKADDSDLLIDFTTPPSPKHKNKAPTYDDAPAMGQLVDISCRSEDDVFGNDDPAMKICQGQRDITASTTYPIMMSTAPEMLDTQKELGRINELLSQETGPEESSSFGAGKNDVDAELLSIQIRHPEATKAPEIKPPFLENTQKLNTEASIKVSTNHLGNGHEFDHQQPNLNRAAISGLNITNLIGTHLLPGRSRALGTGSTPNSQDTESTKEKGHERKITGVSESSSTGTTGSRMRSTPYIPYSAAAMQYAPEYFKALEEKEKTFKELEDKVGSLTLNSPRDAPASRSASPSPSLAAPSPLKREPASNPAVTRTKPWTPGTAVTRQYSGNFGTGSLDAPSAEGPKSRSLSQQQHVRRPSATGSGASRTSNQKSKLSPTVPEFQPSGNSVMTPIPPTTSNSPTPKPNNQKSDQGLDSSISTTPTKARLNLGLEASKYATTVNLTVEQGQSAPRYAYSPQRTPSQVLDTFNFVQSPKRKASNGLEASQYAHPPKRAANQSLEDSRFATVAQPMTGQGLEASRWASSAESKPKQEVEASKNAPSVQAKPQQGLEGSKWASPVKPKPQQGLEGSKWASAPNPKPEQGLSASKFATETSKSRGLEASRHCYQQRSRENRR